MKVLVLVVIFLGFYDNTLFSQDIIIRKVGEDIKAKVTEITEDQVKFKKYYNLDGPVYIIDKSKVEMIRYENGTEDIFFSINEEDSKTRINVEKEGSFNDRQKSAISENYYAKNKDSNMSQDETSYEFIIGGKAGIYIPFSEALQDIYGSGFMGGFVLGYWYNKIGVEFDLKYYYKTGEPYSYNMDEASSTISIMPLTLTAYWSYISTPNAKTYGGIGLGPCFLEEQLSGSAFGQTHSDDVNSTGLEFHLTGGMRFKPFYLELSLSDIYLFEINASWSGAMICGGFFF